MKRYDSSLKSIMLLATCLSVFMINFHTMKFQLRIALRAHFCIIHKTSSFQFCWCGAFSLNFFLNSFSGAVTYLLVNNHTIKTHHQLDIFVRSFMEVPKMKTFLLLLFSFSYMTYCKVKIFCFYKFKIKHKINF